MTEGSSRDRSELLDRFQRRHMVALMFVALLLGGTGLGVALSPPGAVGDPVNLRWWLLPVAVATLVSIVASVRRSQYRSDSPEVKVAMQDEWRRTNLTRASRGALIAVLIGQWPLGLVFGFLTSSKLTPPRIAAAMAAGTIMLGIVTLVGLFLLYDRE